MRAFLVGMEWFPNCAGGLHRYFFEQVHALARAGVQGTALVTWLKPGQRAPLNLRAMAPEGASMLRRWQGARRAAREVFREGVDLVNAHFALYAFPWLRDLPPAVPLVVTFHGPWADELAVEAAGPFALPTVARMTLARHIERAVYSRASRIITLSRAFADLVEQRYGVASERVRVTPGAFDPAPYLAAPPRAEARARLGWPADRPIVLAVRRLARRMGLENLLKAAQIVCRAHPDALFLLGGTGELRDRLAARIEALGLGENARLLGFIPEARLPLAYAAADLTVVPTIALEGFGLITVESLAAGTPTLGTPVGGTPEILRGLEDRLVFASTAPGALADGLLAAMGNPGTLPDAATCRAYALRYSWDTVIPRIRALYDEAVCRRAEVES